MNPDGWSNFTDALDAERLRRRRLRPRGMPSFTPKVSCSICSESS
jgi:hypothetical protein